jgi:hypothetical protein
VNRPSESRPQFNVGLKAVFCDRYAIAEPARCQRSPTAYRSRAYSSKGARTLRSSRLDAIRGHAFASVFKLNERASHARVLGRREAHGDRPRMRNLAVRFGTRSASIDSTGHTVRAMPFTQAGERVASFCGRARQFPRSCERARGSYAASVTKFFRTSSKPGERASDAFKSRTDGHNSGGRRRSESKKATNLRP